MARVKKRFKKRSFRMGMPIGGKHDWDYAMERWKEKKVGPGKWNFVFSQTKYRRGPGAKGGPKPGSRFLWGIRAKQAAIKTGPNTYRLIMKGRKRLLAKSIRR